MGAWFNAPVGDAALLCWGMPSLDEATGIGYRVLRMRSFGPYTNLVEIGRGGMALVYRATAPDGRLVALKLLPPHVAGDATARARFELESTLGLNHPNIVRVNRWGIEQDIPFMEMDYIAGESLDRMVARAGPLPPEQVAGILIDAGRALDYAHERGIIHRDVKPSNIILRTDGRALLADFGVAKAIGATAYTATTVRVGSVFFMSPEQAIGAYELTKASDVYSLGVTAYYALTGRVPFEGNSDVAIARQHVEVRPRHVSDVRPAIPRRMGDVVMWALEKSPQQRPASAGAFARSFVTALTAPLAPSPVPPKPAAPAAAQRPALQPSPARTAPAKAVPTSAPAQHDRPPVTADEELERRGRVPRTVLTGLIVLTALVGIALLALISMAIAADSTSSTSRRPSPAPATTQPAITIFTSEPRRSPTPTPDSVLVPAAVIPPPATVIVAPATNASASVRPTPTRFIPPTREPISPLTPIVPRATLPPSPLPPPTEAPPTEPHLPTEPAPPTPESPTDGPPPTLVVTAIFGP